MKKLDHVTIIGGTHGNEYTGIYLIEALSSQRISEQLNFEFELVHAHPEAFRANRRFIEEDLNRSFVDKNLSGDGKSKEAQIAKDLYQRFHRKTDFLLDLHTTTSNMGATVVLSKTDLLSYACCQYLFDRMPEVRIIEDEKMDEASYFVNRIASSGLLVEVGPVPQGVLRADAYNLTHKIVQHVLDFLQGYKEEAIPLMASIDDYDFDRFKEIETIHYPTDDSGRLLGMIHPDFQDKDFQLIKTGQKIFQLFDQEEIIYEGEEFYPIFINEGAYYPGKIAFTKTRKVSM